MGSDVSNFSAEWLALRESADMAARAPDLIARVVQWSGLHAHISVVDLGAGTGSCLRALAPRILSRQTWRLVDHSGALLEEANTRLAAWAALRGLSVHKALSCWRAEGENADYKIIFEERDLANGFDNIAPVVDLVTVSALLDLVSADWCRALARWCSITGANLYACLNYDGQFYFTPSHPDDIAVCDVINRHQRNDKGLGPALGSGAVGVLLKELAAVGYRYLTAPSPWLLDPSSSVLQAALVRDWSELAREESRANAEKALYWRNFRLDAIEAGQSSLKVGHVDLWAWPER